MPGFFAESSPISETKTWQPSADGRTAKGREGRVMVTDGEAAGALQLEGWAGEARAVRAISASSKQRRGARCLGWQTGVGPWWTGQEACPTWVGRWSMWNSS